jgi:hypothetical protein
MTRDTRRPPDISPTTRVVAVLGVDEAVATDNFASPSLGDGWMVSDFYLWMHVLDGMGRGQEWISCIEPRYLVEKYCAKKETMMVTIPRMGSRSLFRQNGKLALCMVKRGWLFLTRIPFQPWSVK